MRCLWFEELYEVAVIGTETRWVGVTGLGQWETLTIALLMQNTVTAAKLRRGLPLTTPKAPHEAPHKVKS